jgi:hypothetical protein
MKRTATVLTFITALLFSPLFGPQFFSSTVAVQVDNSSTIQIEKPNSSVIYGNSVPLTFNVSHYLDLNGYAAEFSVLWLGYSLDDMAPINITSIPDTGWMSGKSPPFQTALFLFEVPDGTHKIEVMAQGYFINEIGVYRYNISSIPVYFAVAEPPPPESPTTFPTEIVIAASGVSLAAVGVGLLVYFKKRRRGVLQG